jgi:hypothetical protein
MAPILDHHPGLDPVAEPFHRQTLAEELAIDGQA